MNPINLQIRDAYQLRTSETVAMLPFNAGSNNQKLALAGLILHAWENHLPIELPKIVNFTPGQSGQAILPFENFFEVEPLRKLLREHEIEIEDSVERLDTSPHGQEFFKMGAGRLRQYGFDRKISLSDLLPKVILSLNIMKDLAQERDFIALRLRESGVTTACQMRIENDWKEYSEVTLSKRHRDEVVNLSFMDILRKIRDSEDLCDEKTVFVCCDEENLPVPSAEISLFSRRKVGIELLFKSHFKKLAEISTTRTGLSLIDFDLCRGLDAFVGLSRSTFSNLLSFTSAVSGSNGHHYIYNTPRSKVELRIDCGCTISPHDALSTNVVCVP